jgi:hypothetical protein
MAPTHDKTGRGLPGRASVHSGKKKKLPVPFAPRSGEMLASPAYRVLSLSGHRVLARLEIEWLNHAGTNNGRLIVTYSDFEKYGIERHAIGRAIREVVALGFVQVMKRGRAGNAEWRTPTLYRLTHHLADGATSDRTDEWRQIATVEHAEAIATAARNGVTKGRAKKQKSSAQKATDTSAQKATENGNSSMKTSEVPVRKKPLLSISGSGSGSEGSPKPKLH